MKSKRKFPHARSVLQAVSTSRRFAKHAFKVALAAVLAVLGLNDASAATTNSNRVDVTLQANVVESLAIVVANPAIVFGVVTPGANNAAPVGQALAITSTWILSAGETVKLYAYFDSATTALTGALLGDKIPSSAVTASFNSGATQTFTQTSPFTAGSTATILYSVPITAANATTVARADSLALALNLSGVSLHADTYTGTMHLQAQAL